MAKSNYPSNLDTSKELPAVRDNILEIGSETINGLRSAIFNIERALGINPQGSTGNTVANRLNAISDGNGRIKKEALTMANVISGPITNVDVANFAAIEEKKIKLNFPTQVLQDEISILSGELDLLVSQINEISSILSAHVSPSAANRHKAASISVELTSSAGSDTALIDIEANNVQQAIQDLHSRHIDYTGTSISESNNSHKANQIFFDDSNLSGILSADDVQEAIEEASLLTSVETIQHQDRFHSNGYIRNGGFIKDPTNDLFGLSLAKNQVANFSKSSGESDGLSRVTFDTAITLNDFDIKKGDLIIIEDENDTNELYVGTYEIAKINLSTDGLSLESVDIYGYLYGSDTATTLVTVAKNPRQPQPKFGLSLGVREKATLTSADTIQVANPNSVGIISKSAKPSEITSTNRYIAISISGGSEITLDLYDTGSSVQSIESMAKVINEQVAESNLDFLAYRVEMEEGGVELAIVHNQPSNSTLQHTIKLSKGADDALASSGFELYEDQEISCGIGSLYFVNGKPLSGLKSKISVTGLSFFSGGTSITIGNTSENFLTSGIKSGDLLIIGNAIDSSDNGSFVISGVTEETITISPDQLPSGFANQAGDDTVFEIYENILSFNSIVFDEVTESLGAAIIECYITDDQSLVTNKRLEYQAELSGLDPIFTIVNLSDDIREGDQFNIKLEILNDTPFVSINGGEQKRVTGTNYYAWITDGSSNKKLKVFIQNAASLKSYIQVNGTVESAIYGYDSLNIQSNMLLGRVPFGNYKGRAVGGVGADNARIFGSVNKGNVSWDDLSNNAKEHSVFTPIKELRTGGIISGLEVISSTILGGLYKIEIGSGVCYVNGKRFSLSSQIIETDISSSSIDKFYIAINTEGSVVFSPADTTTCDNPFAGSDYVTIATVEYDEVTVRVIDLRLFISDIDLKILNSITVSPDPRLGHFSSLHKALKYAKRFSDLYPEAGVPTVHLKSGTHEVIIEQDESDKDFATWLTEFVASPTAALSTFHTLVYNSGLFIDFPVNIEGEGDGTVLKARSKYTFSDTTASFRGSVVIPGDAFTTIAAPNDVFNSGFITIKNMKLDNTRISMVDMNIETGSTVHAFGIDIDNVIFDFQNFASNSFDTLIKTVAIELSEVADETEYKGNLSVNNCKFINSFLKVSEKERIRNIRFTNNKLLGSESGYLIEQDIGSFDNAVNGSNIEISGNYIADNHNAISSVNAPLLTPNEKMATRMESNMFVGGNIKSSRDISANGFSYNSAQAGYRHIYMDDIRFAALDGASGSNYINIDSTVSGMTIATYNNGTRGVRTIKSEVNTSDRMVIRLPDIKAGQKLTTIAVYFYVASPSGIAAPYDLDIYTEDFSMARTTHFSGAMTGSLLTSDYGLMTKTGLSIDGGVNTHFSIGLQRSDLTGYIQYITQITYIVTTETVEGIGGF